MTIEWTRAPYDLLLPLWRQWLAEDTQQTGHWPLLDRWLKRQVPLLKSHTPGRSAHGKNNPPGIAIQLALSAALFSAMRYLQLAALLEHSYRTQSPAFDGLGWDSTWSPADIHHIPPAAFWYWIALRSAPDASAPEVLRDAAARKAWFLRMQPLFTASTDSQDAPSMLWHGLRPGWASLLQARAQASEWSTRDLEQFIALQNQAPPLWLRPQGNMAVSELAQLLRDEGVAVRLDHDGLCALGGTGIVQTTPYKNGWVEIQDRASQAIATSVAASPGDKVWDACAGAGGKSLAIAARMNNKGMLLATDLHSYKLEELKRRAKRAGVYNIRTFEWQGREALRLPAEAARQQGFDWVLVDAPCTSAGTWRRNPDARWRFHAEDTAELLDLQKTILHSASQAVRRGGQLVYATCSWQVSENEAQVAGFLAAHPDFTVQSHALVGAPEWDADTMFVAVLKRCA